MKSDNNFFIVIVLTIMVLVFYPVLMKKMLPQFFSETTQSTNQEAKKNPAWQKQIQQEIISNATYYKKKSYTLSNDIYDIEINIPAADIKSIKLLNIPDPLTTSPTVLMDTKDLMPGVFNDTGITDNAALTSELITNDSATFEYKQKNGLSIIKHISLEQNMYKITLSYDINNPTATEQSLEYQLVAATGIEKESKEDARFNNQIIVLRNGKTIKKNLNSSTYKDLEGDIELCGAQLRYFSLVTVPLVSTSYVYSYNSGSNDKFSPTSTGLGAKKLIIPANETVRLDYVLYAGPNDHEQMSKLNLQVEQIRGKGLFAGLSDLMLLLLRVLHKLFRNYGLAVVGLALTINIFLYPLTFKSLKSMKDMQAIQPHIEKLRNDLKDNPQKLNKEIMEVYKKHKVNPAGGCLPMLLQMPIFFSLYGVLMRAIELRGASFLWIKNLAAPDAFMSFPGNVPFLGSSLNILPLIMMAFSFLQQKATNTGHANEQQKAMAMMMPFLLGVIFYNFPAGLVLYFLTNSIFSFFIQANLNKKVEELT